MSDRDGCRQTLVLAPHYKAAVTHAQELHLGVEGRDWRFVSAAHGVWGVGPDAYAVVACQRRWEHPEAVAIERVLTTYGLPQASWTWIDC